jgi:RND family efflux transporter MFP subunit
MKRKPLVWSGWLALTTTVILSAQFFKNAEKGAATTEIAQSSPIQVLKPIRRDLKRTFTIPATIAPWQQVTLYSRVPGYLKSIGVDKGDEVKQGQLLAVIDAPEIDEQYEEAKAQYDIKHVTYERYFNVWKDTPNVIAKQDVDVAQAEAKAARYNRDRRRAMLNYTHMYAPFDGRITARFMDPGSFISAGSGSSTTGAAVLTLMELKRLRIYASVPQEVSSRMKPGLPVLLKVKTAPGTEHLAAISRTTGVLDPGTRTMLIEIDIDNKDQRFQSGMFVSATFYLEEHPNVLVLPPAAIITKGPGRQTVLTVTDGKVTEVGIKTGLDDGVWLEVTEGLKGDEDVIAVGQLDLSVGQHVMAVPYVLPAGAPSSQKL